MTSNDRVRIPFRGAGVLLGSLAAGAMLVAPVQAQESVDDAWFAWFGCWQAVGGPAGAPDDAAGDVCITPSEGPVGVDLLTLSGDRVTDSRTLIADGQQRAVEQSGCTGWERSMWSEDRQRLYLRSELDCEGGTRRVTSGVIAMTAPAEWLEVQTIEAGGYPVVRAQRYREASATVAEAAGLALPQNRSLAIETARTAASEPMGIDDLAEASRELSDEALELYLYQLGGTFDVNAENLVAMADAGVPESAIDLVVALAYPDVFNVNTEAQMVGYRPDEAGATEGQEDRGRYGSRVYGRFYDPYWYDSYYYDPYGYYNYSNYSPFGWGGRYGWWSTGGGNVIIVEPRNPESQERGQLVKGRGYTRGGAATTETTRSSSRGARERAGTASPSSRTSTATRSSSSSRGSASTGSSSSSGGRKAKRKGGGGGV